MKKLLVLSFFMIMQGCSTVSPYCDVPYAEGESAATIIIYRPYGVLGLAYSTPMSIDNCKVESMSNDTYVVYKLPEGSHRIAVEKRNFELGSGAIIENYFKSGHIYYLKQTVDVTAGLLIVDKKEALEDMPKLEKVAK